MMSCRAIVVAAAALLSCCAQARAFAFTGALSSSSSRASFGAASPSALRMAVPPVLGGVKAGNRKICVITGTSSGLGRKTAKALTKRGDFFVVCGVRDREKMEQVAREENFPAGSYAVLPVDLASLDSTRQFAKNVKAFCIGRPLDALICNAAVYQPALPTPKWTPDGFEQQFQINHLSHFLLCSLLMDSMKGAKDPRMIIVGSITGNRNTVGGALVYPQADLGNLSGMKEGMKNPISMADGKPFNGAKAYKDSKMMNMMTVNELHRRYHESTGITFSSMYPGCIAETALFREKRQWFRKLFPLFMRYVTGGYVGEDEAGERLAECVWSPSTKKSGVYWSWNGNAKQVGYLKDGVVVGAGGSGGEIFENEQSDLVLNEKNAKQVWELSNKLTGAAWPANKRAVAA
jgi:protochlorophyllide reductase